MLYNPIPDNIINDIIRNGIIENGIIINDIITLKILTLISISCDNFCSYKLPDLNRKISKSLSLRWILRNRPIRIRQINLIKPKFYRKKKREVLDINLNMIGIR